MHRLVTIVLASTLAWPAHAAAAAPSSEDQARRLFEAGSLAYDKGRYTDASRAFGEAYRTLPRPALGFSWAQALRRQYFVDNNREHLTQAQSLLRIYLQDVEEGRRRTDAVQQLQAIAVLLAGTQPESDPRALLPGNGIERDTSRGEDASSTPEPTTEQTAARATELIVYSDVIDAQASIDGGSFATIPVIIATTAGPHTIVVRAPGYTDARSTETAVRGRIIPVEANLQPIPATVTVQAVAGARILLDGRELGFAPLPSPVTTPPGRHRVSVTAPGRVDFGTTLVAKRGDTLHLDARTPHTTQRRAAWGLLGTAGGLAIGGGVTMALALSFQSRVRALQDMRASSNLAPSQREDYNRDLARRDGLHGTTVALWSIAAAASITALVLVLTDRPGRHRRTVDTSQ